MYQLPTCCQMWDDINTYIQVKHPDTDISPIQMRTMHHLPQIFFDTLSPARPDCPVLIPNTFSTARNRFIAQDLYSYTPCGLPTGDLQILHIRLMTASPVTLRALIPAADQATPEQSYYRDLNFYKKTLFHTPFLSRGGAVTSQEYKDAQVQLLPLQSAYCQTKTANLQRHFMQHHARWRTIWFCPVPGCPVSTPNKKGPVKHLQSKQHAIRVETREHGGNFRLEGRKA